MGPIRELLRGHKAVTIFAVAAMIILTSSVIYYFADNNIEAVPQTNTSAMALNNSTGLELILQTNSYVVNQSENITISIRVYNTLNSMNPLNVERNFPHFGVDYKFSVSPCSYQPYGIAILYGNYTKNNLFNVTPLVLYKPGIYSCPAIFAVSQYQFLAHSTNAVMYNPTDNPPDIGTAEFNSSLNFSGYWNIGLLGTAFRTFEPGIYTIVAADGWGDIAILHFAVD